MAAQPTQKNFNTSLNWLFATPLLTFPAAWWFFTGLQENMVAYILQAAVPATLIYLYVMQARYLKALGAGKKVRNQLLILPIALILPCLGASFGDLRGASFYSVASDGIGSDIGAGLVIGGIIALLYLYVLAIGNALYIKTGGKSKGLRITGKIFYGLGYLIIAVITWALYGIIYSLHDPNTE